MNKELGSATICQSMQTIGIRISGGVEIRMQDKLTCRK